MTTSETSPETATPVQDLFRGAATGLMAPAHADALAAGGAEFLTRAFHAYGVLPETNRVARIVAIEPCLIGSTGEKLFLTLAYEQPAPGLATEFFVKFSRHFGDPFHDRRRFELESEVRLFELARKPGFPIRVPQAYFADFEPETGTGVLMTERIPFGSGAIEPLCAKCMDHELESPPDHYRAIIRALAQLAGANHAGQLSPEVDAFFPFDAEAVVSEDRIAQDEAGLRAMVARYAQFAQACPQLLPAHLRTAAFIARLERNVIAVAARQDGIKRHLHADARFVALTHFNPNIDNAWFWRDGDGPMQCGLFDWQRARQMNVACAIWGGLCGAGLHIWTDHLDELLTLFVDELQAHGGPRLAVPTLALHLHLYAATMGIAGLLDAPRLIVSRMPDIAETSGPLDPRLLANEGARCFLHVFTVFLNLWDLHDFGSDLEAILGGIAPDRAPDGTPDGAPSHP